MRDAVSTFTTLPVAGGTLGEVSARRAIAWLPAVGIVLGLIAMIPLIAGLWGRDLLACALAVGVLAWLTGALHLDGLADTADGLGSRRPAPAALEIMRRSDIGPMGVVALIVILGLDVTALASTPDAVRFPALLAACVTGRVAALAASRVGVPAAREDGFGNLFADTSRTDVVVGWVGGAVLLGLLGGLFADGRVQSMYAIGFGVIVGLGVTEGLRRRIQRRLGGVTGDVLGALIEIGTCCCLVVTALLA